MKAAKWRDLSEDEVTQKVRELSEEVFNLRFQLAMGVAKNPSRVREVRRDLARAYTIIRERGGSPAAVAPTPVVEAPKPAAKAPKAAKKPAKRAAKTATAAAKKPKKKAKG